MRAFLATLQLVITTSLITWPILSTASCCSPTGVGTPFKTSLSTKTVANCASAVPIPARPVRLVTLCAIAQIVYHVVNVHTVIRRLALTGEDAMPAKVSTRRALLQTGPVLLGRKFCYPLLQQGTVVSPHHPRIDCHLLCLIMIVHDACRHAFDAASVACSGCWLQKGL